MGFSSILDISSFFIGMIINLIFVALMCYYFKRKYDYLEIAQNEQAKILYQLIHKPMSCPTPSMDFTRDPLVNHVVDRSDIDSDSDSETDSESETNEIQVEYEEINKENKEGIKDEVVDDVMIEVEEVEVEEVEVEVELEDTKRIELDNTMHLSVEEVKQDDNLEITVQLIDNDSNYSKMSIKQLKEVLSSKGIKAKNNMKKDELLELITNEIKA